MLQFYQVNLSSVSLAALAPPFGSRLSPNCCGFHIGKMKEEKKAILYLLSFSLYFIEGLKVCFAHTQELMLVLSKLSKFRWWRIWRKVQVQWWLAFYVGSTAGVLHSSFIQQHNSSRGTFHLP